MANNISVSIKADVADLTAKRAILSAELRAAQRDLNDFARTAAATGATDELRASMLAAAGPVTALRSELKVLDAGLVTHTAHIGTTREAYEGMRVVQALLRGDLARAGEEATRFGERLGAGALVAGAAEMALGVAAVAAVAGLGYLVYEEMEAEAHARSMAEAFALSGRGAYATAQSVKAEIDTLAQMPGVTRESAEALVQFDSTHAEVSLGIANMVNQLAPLYTHVKDGTAAINKLKTELADLNNSSIKESIEKFDQLNKSTLHLGDNETYAITNTLLMGDAAGATTKIINDLGERGGIQIQSVDAAVKQTSASLEQARINLQNVTTESVVAFDPQYPNAFAAAVADATTQVDTLQGALVGLHFVQAEDQQRKINDSANMAGGVAASDIHTHEPRGHHGGARPPSATQEWTEELRAQEIASTDFFKDQTADELAFWQSKLALVKDKSKEWLEVQGHIYDLTKTLAHQAYDNQIAGLNDQLEANKNNWQAEEAVWDTKLAAIRSKNKEESTQVQGALREREAAEREHQAMLGQIARDGRAAALTQLKADLANAQSIREADARTAEAAIQAKGRSSGPMGEIEADKEIAALHQQLLAQQMAADAVAYEAEDALNSQAIADAMKNNQMETAAYTQAIAAKKAADDAFFNHHKQLADQMVNQERADAQKIQQSWHNLIDPMVSTTGNQIKGLITGTESWGQAIENVGEEGLNELLQAGERMAEQWIVNMITQGAAQKASSSTQVASYAGVAGAAGTASMAGAPFPMDLSAPAFGADMAAAAMAFGSFDRGVNVMPHDAIVQVHRGERITPDGDNRAIMSAVAGGRGGAGQTINNHYNPTIHAHEPPSLKRMLQNEGSDMLAFMRVAMRNGALKAA